MLLDGMMASPLPVEGEEPITFTEIEPSPSAIQSIFIIKQ